LLSDSSATNAVSWARLSPWSLRIRSAQLGLGDDQPIESQSHRVEDTVRQYVLPTVPRGRTTYTIDARIYGGREVHDRIDSERLNHDVICQPPCLQRPRIWTNVAHGRRHIELEVLRSILTTFRPSTPEQECSWHYILCRHDSPDLLWSFAYHHHRASPQW
jgi:hypothetical protein